MRWLRTWWRQPDHFDWLSGYLQVRGLSRVTRRTLAVVAASLALIPANVLWGPAPINRQVALILAVVAAVTGLGMAALWWTHWPTRRQSIAYAAVGSACTAGGCLWQSNPLVGLMACTALAVSGGYIAFFHTAGYMMLNFMLAVTVGAVEAIRLAMTGEAVLAVTGYFLVLELNFAVPFAIQVVVRTLGMDLLRSDRDPLTGLLNRRAMAAAAVGRLIASTDRSFLAVAMVDLDRFKSLNDSRGHAAGDEALIAVAQALNEASPRTALIGRVGGEEFLVVDGVTTLTPSRWGQRLCDAVAALPARVTASVGTATVAVGEIDCDHAEEAFRQLVSDADTAMYAAKHHGGNRTHHRETTSITRHR